jgi:hypothetical protein
LANFKQHIVLEFNSHHGLRDLCGISAQSELAMDGHTPYDIGRSDQRELKYLKQLLKATLQVLSKYSMTGQGLCTTEIRKAGPCST